MGGESEKGMEVEMKEEEEEEGGGGSCRRRGEQREEERRGKERKKRSPERGEGEWMVVCRKGSQGRSDCEKLLR